jgi:hypothetical protein
MILFSRGVKVWLAISLLSLALWAIYWFKPSYEHFFTVVQGIPDSYVSNLGIVFWSAHLGLNSRFIGALLGLIALFMFWRSEILSKRIELLVGCAVFFESLYFVFLVPFIWNLYQRGVLFLSYSYLVQVIATVPIMITLTLKIVRYDKNKSDLLKWAGFAFFGYVMALWANAVMRWFDMISVEGSNFLFNGIRVTGFLNATILLSIAVIFALVGAVSFTRGIQKSALKWIGLAVASVGLHYIVYAIYSYYVNALSFTLLIDIWAMPFLGLGTAILLMSHRSKDNSINRK